SGSPDRPDDPATIQSTELLSTEEVPRGTNLAEGWNSDLLAGNEDLTQAVQIRSVEVLDHDLASEAGAVVELDLGAQVPPESLLEFLDPRNGRGLRLQDAGGLRRVLARLSSEFLDLAHRGVA